MNERNVVRIVLALLVIALAVGIGVVVYQAGYAQGAVESGRINLPPVASAPFVYAPWFYHPFGFGFFPFGCLFPLLGILLVFLLVRAVFWGGRWGGPRHWDGGVPPRFEEWHRRAHGEPQPNPQPADR